MIRCTMWAYTRHFFIFFKPYRLFMTFLCPERIFIFQLSPNDIKWFCKSYIHKDAHGCHDNNDFWREIVGNTCHKWRRGWDSDSGVRLTLSTFFSLEDLHKTKKKNVLILEDLIQHKIQLNKILITSYFCVLLLS